MLQVALIVVIFILKPNKLCSFFNIILGGTCSKKHLYRPSFVTVANYETKWRSLEML